MKKCFSYSVINLLLVWAAMGQATFRLQNLDPGHGIDAPVFDALGAPLAGASYRAELWGAAAPEDLVPALNLAAGSSRLAVPFSAGGYFFSSASFLSVPSQSTGGGGFAWLQVRAWDSRLGALYEDVATLGVGGYGESPLFYARGNDPFREPAEPPAPLAGLQSFSLRPVPEPSTWALLALGGLAIGWALRRQH